MGKEDASVEAVNRLAKRVLAYRAEHNESMTRFAKGAGVSIETIKSWSSTNAILKSTPFGTSPITWA